LLKILLIDDSADYRKLFSARLHEQFPDAEVDDYDPVQGLPGTDFNWLDYNLILLDYDLGLGDEETGLDWLRRLHGYGYPDMPPILMLTGADSSRIAVEALKLGADNYLLKKEIEGGQMITRLMAALEQESLEIQSAPEGPVTEDPHENTLPHNTAANAMDAESATFQNMTQTGTSSVAESESEVLELEVPGYKLLKVIGKGGMSSVVLAERMEDKLHVVLKVMFTRGMEDPTSLKRFMQEYNLLSNVSHPHVVRIYERAFAADFAYIAMEYFPAGDLAGRIREGIRPAEALEYLRQMASGLGAVHELSIVHRDIKPGNILFKEEGSLTITDFGVAKHITDEYEDITINNMVVGTPYYISPEQGSGMKVDQRSDLYSLGVIFYQMLTGKRPYSGNSVSDPLRAHIAEPVPRLPDYLIKYQPLIDGLLAKDPDDRFQNARELLIGIDWKR
jgi:eukaryotic-like serine/threonine-protein kinase